MADDENDAFSNAERNEYKRSAPYITENWFVKDKYYVRYCLK